MGRDAFTPIMKSPLYVACPLFVLSMLWTNTDAVRRRDPSRRGRDKYAKESPRHAISDDTTPWFKYTSQKSAHMTEVYSAPSHQTVSFCLITVEPPSMMHYKTFFPSKKGDVKAAHFCKPLRGAAPGTPGSWSLSCEYWNPVSWTACNASDAVW